MLQFAGGRGDSRNGFVSAMYCTPPKEVFFQGGKKAAAEGHTAHACSCQVITCLFVGTFSVLLTSGDLLRGL